MRENGRHSVLVIVTWPLSEDTGYTVNARRTIEALREAGHQVRVCQVVHRSHLRQARSYEQGEPETRTLMAPFDRRVPLARALLRNRLRSQLRGQIDEVGADIVHARGIRAGALIAGVEVPVLLDVRGDIVAETEAEVTTWPAAKASRYLAQAADFEAVAFAHADGLAVVSDAMLDWAVARSPRLCSLPSAVIPCSLAIDGSLPASAGPQSDHLVAVYCGGFQSYQPPSVVFGALARVGRLRPDAELRVMTQDRRAIVEETRDRSCPQASIERLGAEEVLSALRSADLGLIPRVDHPANRVSCPTKIAEYLAAGVPAAASAHLGRWAERLVEWDVGVPLEASDDDLRSFLERVRAERSAFRDRCMSVAREQFSMRSTVERLESLYAALASEARRP